MKIKKFRNKQEGMALLAAILIIAIFTILGMMNAKQAKESEKISSGNVRYQTVFQAAEISMRNAVEYINKSGAELAVGYAGSDSNGRAQALNFDISSIANNRENILYNPDAAIIWDRKRLQDVVCGGENKCAGGIDFMARMDENFWKTHGITSTFGSDSHGENYIKETETYVFIELLQTLTGGQPGGAGSAKLGEFTKSGENGKEIFYLITVKASGFPPGLGDAKSPLDSRENVIIQAVFAKRA